MTYESNFTIRDTLLPARTSFENPLPLTFENQTQFKIRQCIAHFFTTPKNSSITLGLSGQITRLYFSYFLIFTIINTPAIIHKKKHHVAFPQVSSIASSLFFFIHLLRVSIHFLSRIFNSTCYRVTVF
jgi:hypothetical protein